MSDKKKEGVKDAFEQIDLKLDGLLGNLGEALSGMMETLEKGQSGALNRDFTFETPKGPARVHTGVRMRVGGLNVGQGQEADPQPVNPKRPKPAAKAPSEPVPKTFDYDLFEDGSGWRLIADLPGVARSELSWDVQDGGLLVRTNGTRRYLAEIEFEGVVVPDGIEATLENGVLDMHIPVEASS